MPVRNANTRGTAPGQLKAQEPHIVDKAVLAEAVWGDHIDMVDNFQFVYAQIKNLRKKIAEAGADMNIKAVYGFGYKFAETEE